MGRTGKISTSRRPRAASGWADGRIVSEEMANGYIPCKKYKYFLVKSIVCNELRNFDPADEL